MKSHKHKGHKQESIKLHCTNFSCQGPVTSDGEYNTACEELDGVSVALEEL